MNLKELLHNTKAK
ncbi:UDP-N-acetylmuramyl-tripeptide synthetase family protein, partial [Chlamydia psittaci 06-1683]